MSNFDLPLLHPDRLKDTISILCAMQDGVSVSAEEREAACDTALSACRQVLKLQHTMGITGQFATAAGQALQVLESLKRLR